MPTCASWAPATRGSGPPTTSPPPTRRCASWSSSRRPRASGRPAATAAGAPRCSRRRWPPSPGATTETGRRHCTAPMIATVDEVGRVAAEEGIDCHFDKGGTITLARTPVQVERARAEVAEARAWGVGEDDVRWLSAAEASESAGRDRRPRCDVHAALRRDPPGPAGARPRRRRGRSRGGHLRGHPGDPAGPGTGRHARTAWCARRSWSGRPRATRLGCRDSGERSRRSSR